MEPQEDDNDDKEPYCSNATDDEQTGPYFLESVLDEVQLSADGSESDIGITCVEYWGEWHRESVDAQAIRMYYSTLYAEQLP